MAENETENRMKPKNMIGYHRFESSMTNHILRFHSVFGFIFGHLLLPVLYNLRKRILHKTKNIITFIISQQLL
jgi:hypothetical protein